MATSTDAQKDQTSSHVRFLAPQCTKQFRAEDQLQLLSPPKRTVFPISTFSLETQPEDGEAVQVDFDLYHEADLPFLDKSTDVGRMVSKNIINQALDDDVMTDDEMIKCAERLLGKEVEKAIKQFNSGFDKSYIRNLKM